ncbi:hypothetical protein [Methanosarcina sp. DH2]|nr:hypothetical protein [Methanosarcina sp. DH2]
MSSDIYLHLPTCTCYLHLPICTCLSAPAEFVPAGLFSDLID